MDQIQRIRKPPVYRDGRYSVTILTNKTRKGETWWGREDYLFDTYDLALTFYETSSKIRS